MNRILLIILLLAIGSTDILSQKINPSILSGDLAFENFRYEDAVVFYKSVLEKEPEDNEVKLKLGESYRKMNNHSEAVEWYGQVLDSNGDDYDDIYKLHYAQALLYNEDKENARKWFDIYRMRDSLNTLSDNRIDGIENFERFFRNTDSYSVKKIEINSPSRDFSPTFYKDGIVFVSDRKKNEGKNDWDNRVFLNLFYSRLSENGSFYTPEELSNKLNTLYHEGPVSIYNDEKSIVFTRNNYHKKKLKRSEEGINNLQLFFADINENGQWKNTRPFIHNSPEYSTGHPTMNSTGDMMIFSSDRPGGSGGSDLYYSQKVNDVWSEPINLGGKVNTAGEELFPYLHQDSILYFSSNGHRGLGGLDIYRASFTIQNTAGVENMGVPINSNVDDFGFIMNKRSKKGYFSSNRESYENDEIYEFRIIPIGVQIRFIDKETNEKVITTNVRIHDKDGNRQPHNYMSQAFRFTTLGTNDYELNVQADGYESKKVSFSTTHLNPGEVLTLDVEMNKITEQLQEEIELVAFDKKIFFGVDGNLFTPFDLGVSINPDEDLLKQLVDKGYDVKEPLIINTIYYDYDRDDLRKAAKRSIENIVAVMNKYQKTNIEISSHTDSNGSLKYNAKLSAERSKSVFDQLVSLKLDEDRIEAKSYGELFPVNNCRDGEVCTDEQYQQNRRTEFTLKL